MKQLIAAIFLVVACSATAEPGTLKVGVGRAVISPEQDMWMAGYASRNTPSQGKIHDLWAKAIAFEDQTGARAVVVTLDLVAISRATAEQVATLALERHQLPRPNLMLAVSHTHCGPVANDRLANIYGLDEQNAELSRRYSEKLPELILQAITGALGDLEAASVHWRTGHTDFAGNRRTYTAEGISGGFNPAGVTDHTVPNLLVRRADGSTKAFLFLYACHNTSTSIMQFNGDYAGFAQLALEEASPGATALFVSGCGADQNPHPRGTIELAEQHGRSLAQAVLASGEGEPVSGPLRTAFEEVALALTDPPTREQIEEQAKLENVYEQRRAQLLLGQLDKQGHLDGTYPYPVQVWQFASGHQLTALGGEVVVDYALRLKYELGEKQMVIGYANDVMAYIPSLRILREGGYEGAGAMLYYGFHGPWAPTIEETIVGTAVRLSKTE
jgi:neutral ceramidase